MWLCCGDSITIIVLQPESLKRWFGGFLLQPSFLSRFNQFSSLYQSGLISWSVFVTSLLRKKQDDALGGGVTASDGPRPASPGRPTRAQRACTQT